MSLNSSIWLQTMPSDNNHCLTSMVQRRVAMWVPEFSNALSQQKNLDSVGIGYSNWSCNCQINIQQTLMLNASTQILIAIYMEIGMGI